MLGTVLYPAAVFSKKTVVTVFSRHRHPLKGGLACLAYVFPTARAPHRHTPPHIEHPPQPCSTAIYKPLYRHPISPVQDVGLLCCITSVCVFGKRPSARPSASLRFNVGAHGLPTYPLAQNMSTSTRGGKGTGTGWAHHTHNCHLPPRDLCLERCCSIEPLCRSQCVWLPADNMRPPPSKCSRIRPSKARQNTFVPDFAAW